jgi:vancomycin permeability regulator SanA
VQPGQDGICPADSREGFAVLVGREHPSHLRDDGVQVGPLSGPVVHPKLQGVSDLPGLDTDLLLVVRHTGGGVDAECEPHGPVEGLLVAMPEPHEGNLAQVVGTSEIELGQPRRLFRIVHDCILQLATDKAAGRPKGPDYPGPVPLHRSWAAAVLAAAGGSGLLGLAAVGACAAFVRKGSAERIYPEGSVPPAPVALVLGAQVYPDGTPSSFLRARLDLAKRLLDACRVRVILVSGDGEAPEYDEPTAMHSYLRAAGVPADRILLDRAGRDTYDSCYRARHVFGIDRAILVSQSYHLPRAVGTALRLGLEATGVGDETVRRNLVAWTRGTVRDQLACVKSVVDLMTHRDPLAPGRSPDPGDGSTG